MFDIRWIKDPYIDLSNDALERFLLFISDVVVFIEKTQPANLEQMRLFMLKYIDVCVKEKRKKDKTITKNFIKTVKNLIKFAEKDELGVTLKTIVNSLCING